jgi:DNA topoisomerase III
MRQVEAVAARSELDLRLGASFTRFQTLTLQPMTPMLDQKIISYGS